ncbi:MAG: hypothetical protein B6U95_07455 [Thermofilum sp. ex4484_82]|nr:MAG: hypothetical protein B6U95_07455 [Thermofilum sp. ex4484_82]OYT37109.1 MAG: hypothetical protein B6U96_07450 [Archaeoglobales archaeon ex4484_92]
MTLLNGSNFTASKLSIESPSTRKISEASAKPILAKEDKGMRPRSILLFLEKRCVIVTTMAGIAEIRYTVNRNGMLSEVKNITEINHEPK